MSLSTRLKAVRESMGKNQKEFAKLVGASFRAWQDYEAGISTPGGKVFESLAKLGVNTNWLLTGEGPMKRGEAAGGQQAQANGHAVNGIGNSTVHIGIHGTAPAPDGAVTSKEPEDPVTTAFVKDWLSLPEVERLKIWVQVKEKLEKTKGGEA